MDRKTPIREGAFSDTFDLYKSEWQAFTLMDKILWCLHTVVGEINWHIDWKFSPLHWLDRWLYRDYLRKWGD